MENGKNVHTLYESGQEVSLEIIRKPGKESSVGENLSRNHPLKPFKSCFIHWSGKQFACMYGECPNRATCFGSDSDDETEEYHALRFHATDRKTWNDQIFPDIVRFAESLSVLDCRDYRFSFNHRYILPDGRVSQFIHEGTLSVVIDSKLPMMRVQEFTEIGDLKADDTMVLSIFKYSVDWGYQKIFSKVYPRLQGSVLTSRELEIIRLCQEGFSCKMIADKLQLSIHTVKNHKRKSMSKTSTHNITELIHVCLQNHWL